MAHILVPLLQQLPLAECGETLTTPRPPPRMGRPELQMAHPHSWPWQVSVRQFQANWRHICSGTLVAAQWVLTSAKCV